MYNYDKKITYYFGAGASANAIPMVNGINNALDNLETFIYYTIRSNTPISDLTKGNDTIINIGGRNYRKQELEDFSSYISIWNKKVKPTPSIDTFAKRLFDNNKAKEYAEYKVFLTIVFHFFHFFKNQLVGEEAQMNTLDGRYENLFRSINSKEKNDIFNTLIPYCFKFITWNYDFQFEYSRVLDFAQEEQPQYDKISAFYNSMINRFIKLNGNSFLDKFDNVDYPSKVSHVRSGLSLFSLLFLIYEKLINNEEEITTFRFSWEYKVDLELLAEIAKKTDILVIIGYSFPSFNRMIDKAFYLNLKQNCVIYTQGKDMQDSIRIKNYFEQCFKPNQNSKDIIPVESPFFFVPPHYFDPEYEQISGDIVM